MPTVTKKVSNLDADIRDWSWDLETYPNVFLFGAKHIQSGMRFQFEISDWKNESKEIVQFCHMLKSIGARMVGFNNLGFDYPVLHLLLRMGYSDCNTLYQKAQAIFATQNDDEDDDSNARWRHQVKPSDRMIDQIDLFKIHHFDNFARATSLKALEFKMLKKDIKDLPYPPGTVLTLEQVPVLRTYHAHDIDNTADFYLESLPQIRFREELTIKYQRDFMNHNDGKIGKDYFIMELEKAGIHCYTYSPEKGRVARQTPRKEIALCEAILPSIQFKHPEFNRVLNYLKDQVIRETKGVFKGLTATINGFTVVFGTGGLHGSINNETVYSTSTHIIKDIDVEAYYPSTGIAQRFKPDHFPELFCDLWANMKAQRKMYTKKEAPNKMLKDGSNSVFGDSNNRHSVFYDPLLLMKITLNGQLMLCMLIEWLYEYCPGIRMIQANTDGITAAVPRDRVARFNEIVAQWENFTKLKMEHTDYEKMCIRDVNNYVAVKPDGTNKLKGAYGYEMGWHQDHSSMVVAKVAEKVLTQGANIRETILNWPDKMDFMIMIKVPRSGYLTWSEKGSDVDTPIQNTTRYYVAKGGVKLNKWLKPLVGKTDWRKSSVEAGWLTCVCNDLDDAVLPIDYDYYINEVEKLCLPIL